MAILLPLLLLILIGIIEFGRIFNVQISLNQAAREGARYAAIHYDDAAIDVSSTALAAAPSLDNLTVLVADDADACSDGDNVEVTASTTLTSATGLFDVELLGMPVIFPLELTGIGVMRCGG